MSNQQPIQYDENRFTIPKEHPQCQELTSVTKESSFAIIKTGFDYYHIPFFFNGDGFVIGEGDDQIIIAPKDYSKWYEEYSESHINEQQFISENLLPYFNQLINQAAEKRLKHTAEEAFDAYRYLSSIEFALLVDKNTKQIKTFQTSWEIFHNLKILTSYIPRVYTLTHELADGLYYMCAVLYRWQPDIKYTFFLGDITEMMKVFAALRSLYFQYEYAKSPKEPTLQYILEDCQKLATLYTCRLDISLEHNSATILGVRGKTVRYTTYKLFTESESEYAIDGLLYDIQQCRKREYIDTKERKKIKTTVLDTYDALTKFLRTL